jgi:hypothetical protein
VVNRDFYVERRGCSAEVCLRLRPRYTRHGGKAGRSMLRPYEEKSREPARRRRYERRLAARAQ